MIKLAEILPYMRNSINIHLPRVFLHAEFISVMKTVTKSYGFHENAKIIENHSFLLIFEIFTETLEQIVTKSHQILILDGKEDK